MNDRNRISATNFFLRAPLGATAFAVLGLGISGISEFLSIRLGVWLGFAVVCFTFLRAIYTNTFGSAGHLSKDELDDDLRERREELEARRKEGATALRALWCIRDAVHEWPFMLGIRRDEDADYMHWVLCNFPLMIQNTYEGLRFGRMRGSPPPSLTEDQIERCSAAAKLITTDEVDIRDLDKRSRNRDGLAIARVLQFMSYAHYVDVRRPREDTGDQCSARSYNTWFAPNLTVPLPAESKPSPTDEQ